MTVRRASYAFCLDAIIYGFCKTAVFYQSCAFTGIVRHALSLPCILHTAAVHFKNKGIPIIMAALPVDSPIHAEVQCLLETFQPGIVSKAQEFFDRPGLEGRKSCSGGIVTPLGFIHSMFHFYTLKPDSILCKPVLCQIIHKRKLFFFRKDN